MLVLDDVWDAAIEAVLAEAFPPRYGPGRRTLHEAVLELSTAYNEMIPPPRGAAALAARLAFFLRADLLKTTACLAECAAAGVVFGSELLVLDVGAGLGAASFGVLEYLTRRSDAERVRIIALDEDAAALELGLKVHAATRGRFTPSTFEPRLWRAGAPIAGGGRFDLIVAQNVLCELSTEPDGLTARLFDALAPDGTLLLIEPALRETSRRLHALRDRLVAGGRTVLAPCTRTSACPALADPGDWCHEDRAYQPSPGLARLVQATGLRRGGLKYSYLCLRRDERTLGRAVELEAPERVVSDPLITKGKTELWVCGADGKRRLTLLDRARSEGNGPLCEAGRGDLLQVGTLDAKGRVGAETRVARWSLDPD